ncbi:MAG: ParB N-terminal domain-containing protein [Gammaproteobacteria bacterium]|nr:ParB N-terminal domain-containing protein [Gammaproteobacteria bacterium]
MSGDLLSKLTKPGPGSASPQPITAGDPIEPTPMLIHIDDIKEYDRNPRRSDNSEYEAIRASIKQRGMEATLNITRRPGGERYIPWGGGNTRVRVLKELYAETGDARYKQVRCIYRPWTDEAEVLVAHLIENDVRGDYTFLDRAQGVFDLTQELGLTELSQRQLAATLSEKGYRISHSHISQLMYALNVLFPSIPQALASGMGKPKVVKLRQYDSAGAALWERHGHDPEQWQTVFQTILTRFDDPDWEANNQDFDQLRRALENEIADGDPDQYNMVAVEFGVVLGGGSLDTDLDDIGDSDETGTDEISDDSTAPIPGLMDSAVLQAAKASPSIEPVQRDSTVDDGSHNESTATPPASTTPSLPPSPEQGIQGGDIDVNGLTSAYEPPLQDLKSLRGRAWTLATRLAQRFHLKDLVAPLKNGFGYIVMDTPDPAALRQAYGDNKAGFEQALVIWGEITAYCEVTVQPQLHALLQPGAFLEAIQNDDAYDLATSNRISTYIPYDLGGIVWGRIDDRAWQDLQGLRETYRLLAQNHHLGVWDLWKGQPV